MMKITNAARSIFAGLCTLAAIIGSGILIEAAVLLGAACIGLLAWQLSGVVWFPVTFLGAGAGLVLLVKSVNGSTGKMSNSSLRMCRGLFALFALSLIWAGPVQWFLVCENKLLVGAAILSIGGALFAVGVIYWYSGRTQSQLYDVALIFGDITAALLVAAVTMLWQSFEQVIISGALEWQIPLFFVTILACGCCLGFLLWLLD